MIWRPDKKAMSEQRDRAARALRLSAQEQARARSLQRSFQATINRLAQLNQENNFAEKMAIAYGVKP